MKEEKTKKRKLLYYLVLAISVCLLTAATVLTVYFVSDGKTGSLDNNPPGQVVTPPDDNPGGNEPEKPDDKPAGGETPIYTNPANGIIQRHKGVDFAADEGAEVAAIADGTVTAISLNAKTGNVITIDHGDGLVGIYRFVEPVSTLKEGAKVTKGQCFATVAAAYGSEKLDGTHLHFELELKGKSVDPASYLNIRYEEK